MRIETCVVKSWVNIDVELQLVTTAGCWILKTVKKT